MREQFIDKSFHGSSLRLIQQANEIIGDYARQGFTLTLRQLYYQFVSRAIIPNTERSYSRLGSVINDARLAGLIDWNAIEDRTRNLMKVSEWGSPSEIVGACAAQYAENLWDGQPFRPEVWIEKEALIGVVEGICNELRVPYFACRGYTSQSEAYVAGKRMLRYRRAGHTPIVLHFGDHDPSGIDMTRDNDDRLSMFAGAPVEVRRLALNMDQIERYNPPPNPAKVTDSRFEDYQRRFGDESWELDALDPQAIVELVRGEVEGLIDRDIWDAAKAREDSNKAHLELVSGRWDDVSDFLSGDGEERGEPDL